MKLNPQKKINLPYSYAWDLLNCEIQLELSSFINSQLVKKLIELYQLGSDYYLSIQSSKFEFFNRKKANLLQKQQIRNIIQQTNIKSNPIQTINVEQKKLEHEKIVFTKMNQFGNKNQITEWIKNNHLKVLQLEETAKNQIDKQKQKLESRLSLRKKRFGKKLTSATFSTACNGTLCQQSKDENESYTNKFMYSEQYGL